MSLRSGFASLLRLLVLACVAAPLLAMVSAAFVVRDDRDGSLAPTVVPPALVLLDPTVGRSLRRSVTAAVVITVTSVLLASALARVSRGRVFPGRRLGLAPLVLAAACPPWLGALGFRAVLDRLGLDGGGGLPYGLTIAANWLALGWVHVAFLTPWLFWRIDAALAPLSPALEDAARCAGLSERARWWRLAWPLARPALARPVAAAFGFVLLEPGAPLVLGLRRTLAAQTAEALFIVSPGHLARAATLTLLILAMVLVVRALLDGWVGVPVALGPAGPIPPSGNRRPRLGPVGFLGLLVTFVLVVAPVCATLLFVIAGPSESIGGLARALSGIARADLTGAVGFGLGAALLGLPVGWTLAGSPTGRAATAVLRAVPPLALGVGVAALAVQTARWELPSASGGSGIIGGLVAAVGRINPRLPGLGSALFALALVLAPWWALVFERFGREAPIRAALAARTVGGTRARVARTRLRIALGPLAMALAMTSGLGAIGLSPAWALDPLLELRPVGAALFTELGHPDYPASVAPLALLVLLVGIVLVPAIAGLQREPDADWPRL